MCFSRLKNIKSLTSKNSGTLIVSMSCSKFVQGGGNTDIKREAFSAIVVTGY
jgi:hypothetical protein